jgi:hypothetical protein
MQISLQTVVNARTKLTLKMIKSSSGTAPDLTRSPSIVRRSWTFPTTFSVTSPDKISLRTALGMSAAITSHDGLTS